MRITVVGTGYVGLVVGTGFSDFGNEVVCVDIDPQKVAMLSEGKIPIYEPGLEELVTRNVENGRLRFTTDLAEAVRGAQVVFIAVQTPEGEDGEADLQYVLTAARQIGEAMDGYTVVVQKSTAPMGTLERIREEIAAVTDHPFDVVSNPEFLRQGAAVDDFLSPDRVVIGTDSERAKEIVADLYAPFYRKSHRILFMDPRSAELTKYAANAMLATRISFMNEISRLCEKVGADVEAIRQGVGTDARIGPSFLFPGPGFGGSCFPKDIRALRSTARENGIDLAILKAVEEVNEEQKMTLLRKATRFFDKEGLAGRTFGVWGLAFKPKTDDMRGAPSIPLIEGLLGKGAVVQAHDPVAKETARRVFGDRIQYADTPYQAAEGVDALFVVTEWHEFRRPDFVRLKETMKAPTIFDGRNLYEPDRLRELGFTYHALGRGTGSLFST